jgi:3',5'-nucleoside bisphosphate phosphatase
LIDLHTHSNYSDGSDEPAALVDRAVDAGCTALALTDHDTTEGLDLAAQRATERGIELIPGIELSCHSANRAVHLLGYFIDRTDAVLQERLTNQRRLRDERNDRLILRLAELGITMSMEDVAAEAGAGAIGRPHFAAVLVRQGHASSIDDAFVRFLADDAPAHVHRRELPVAHAIALIHEAGGVAVWAHPMTPWVKHINDLDADLNEMIDAGLDGIEARYARYDGDVRRQLVKLARRHSIVATGGSDYHGTFKPDLAIGAGLGDLDVPYEVIPELRERIR